MKKYNISWEVKRTGNVKELATFDRVEYECFVEYLREHEYLFEILENYATDSNL